MKKTYKFLLSKAKHIHITDLNRDVTFKEWTKLGSSAIKTIGEAGLLMDKRNQWQVDQLVDINDFLLSFHDGSPGGTNNCIRYAKSKGKKIINIEPL